MGVIEVVGVYLLASCLQKYRVLEQIQRDKWCSTTVERLKDDLRAVTILKPDRDQLQKVAEAHAKRCELFYRG